MRRANRSSCSSILLPRPPQGGILPLYSVHLFNTDTLKPLCHPFRDLSFSTAINSSALPHCHTRGESIVFTCQVMGVGNEITNIVKLFHWKTGILLFEVSSGRVKGLQRT